jgi:hypothetical protein
MALSHHEQQALDRIEIELLAEDPRLASGLAHDLWTVRRMRHRLFAAVAFGAGMAMMTSAILIPHDTTIGGVLAVCVLAYLVMAFAALWWCNGPFRPRRGS